MASPDSGVPVRVLYAIDSLAQGGAERSLVELAPHLVRLGVDLDVAVLHARQHVLAEELEAGGARLHDVAGRGRLDAIRRLRSLIRARRPDLVHTTLYDANQAGRVAAALCRTPVVSSLVNTPYGPDHLAEPGLSRARVRLAQALDATTVRLARRLHANAAHVADTMAARLRVPRERFDVIPRGRDAEALGRRTPERTRRVRQQLAVADDEQVVLALARHEQQKGLDVAVAALAEVRRRHPRARLLVAGREGAASERLRAQIDAAGLDGAVELLGFREDVADLLAAADVFVLPSRREGFPGVVVEAMALEVPIVATDLPGVREALGEGSGTLVPVDDAGALARAVSAVLDGGGDRDVAQARERFLRRFTIGSVAAEMAAFYERAVS